MQPLYIFPIFLHSQRLHWSGISTSFCPCSVPWGQLKNVAPLSDSQNFRLLPLQKACWLHLSGQRRDVLADIGETPGWAKLDMSLDGMS